MKNKLALPMATLLGISVAASGCPESDTEKLDPKELTTEKVTRLAREEAKKLAALVRQHPDAVGVQENPPEYLGAEEKKKALANHIRFRMFPPEKVDVNGVPIETCEPMPCCLADGRIPPGHSQCSTPCADFRGNPEMDCRVRYPIPTVMRAANLHSLKKNGHGSYQIFLPPEKGPKDSPPEYRLFLVNAEIPTGETCEVELVEQKQPSNDYVDKLTINCHSITSANVHLSIRDHGINGVRNGGEDIVYGESMPKPEDAMETSVNTEAEHIHRDGSKSATDITITYKENVFSKEQLKQINHRYLQLARDIRDAIKEKLNKWKIF